MSKAFCDSANYARLRLLHLLYDIEVIWQNTIKRSFSMFYTLDFGLLKCVLFNTREAGHIFQMAHLKLRCERHLPLPWI